MDVITDTSFLIGLWRQQDWAVQFAVKNPQLIFGIPWVVLGEFWQGAVAGHLDSGRVGEFLNLGLHLTEASEIVSSYAHLCAALQLQKGWKEIGQNDLWIGACALALDKPLLTRNKRHFHGMPGLRLIEIGT